ncbi:DNA-processing protein DprA [Camelimonas fluminis]|uniref:DNA-processing protein DprA n=1 Tax=Camelimonas fluminis TaxID=1576911 RepID=A0ABV7UJB5_9HYPH|nr:DNA-processing protein DprA [Camelimonas fluminis]
MASRPRLLDDQTRFDWLRLLRTDGVGPRTFLKLFSRYGSAGAALAALPSLAARSGRMITPPHPDVIARELDAAERMGVRFVARGEAGYPPALRAIDSAPPLLAIRGQAAVLDLPCVAIVGSRNASASGMRFAGALAGEIGGAGYGVVSGLARGVDARAHAASLLTGTVAVLAGGHDRIYPREHAELLDAILERGAVVSEMPMGWTPRGRDFPRRNRIVSGISLGVVVVEAALRSGSLITARFAAEQGREVFAVPGSPLDPRAAGTNGLLRDGATICCAAADVIEALAPMRGRDLAADGAGLLETPADIESPLWEEFDADILDDGPGDGFDGNLGRAAATTHRAASAPLSWAFEEGQAPFDLQPEGASDLFDSTGDSFSADPDQVAPAAAIARLLGPSPLTVDDLIHLSGLSASEVNVALVELDLEGRLERHGAQAVSLAVAGAS